MVVASPSHYIEEATLIREWAAGDEIVLDNIPIRVERGVGYSLTNVFGRKQMQGEPGPDDHQYNSTHTQRNWLSGSLTHDLQETADIGKFWRSHAWTQTRGALGHALKVVKIPLHVDAGPGPVYPLDRMGDSFFWAVGWREARIFRHVEETHTMENPGNVVRQVEGLVTNVGITFRTVGGEPNTSEVWMYIPTTEGYTRMAEDFATHDHRDFATVGFALNENKLYRLSATGQVWSIIAHDDDWQYVATLPDGSEPRNIYRTFDDDANRIIGVTTSSGMWMLDHDNGILWDTDLTFPEHAYQGYGAALWRGEDFISVGVGIHRKVGTLITPAGLDNADGLPAPYAGGLIVDLEPSYNLLVAAIASEPPPEVISYTDPPIPETWYEQYGQTEGLPYPMVGTSTHWEQQPEIFLPDVRRGAIFCWNGLGWSEMYTWNRAPTRVKVTMVRNLTRFDRHQHLFFGDVDGGAYSIHIPSTYYNPIESPNLPLDRLSYLEESRIDWNMPDTPKIAKQLNVKPKHLWHKLTPEQVDPYFNRIQIICHWIDILGIEHTSEDVDVLLGPGPYPFSDGVMPLPYLELRAATETENIRRAAPIGWERYRNTQELLPTGLPHEAIWMSYRFIGDARSDFTGGVIQWRTIIARKWSRPSRIYTFVVDCNSAVKGLSETDVMDLLDRMCLKHSGVPMVTGDQFRIVDVTRLDGNNEAGGSPRGFRTITCLEFTDETYELPILGPT